MLSPQRSATMQIRGVEKAALVLLTVSKAVAVELLRYFEPEELEAVRKSASRLRSMGADELGAVLAEFEQTFRHGVRFVGTPDELDTLIESATNAAMAQAGPESARLPDSAPPAPVTLWARVEDLDQEALRTFVVAEHPQAAAFVLSRISREITAQVIGPLPAPLRNELLIRMLDAGSVADVAIEVVETVIREELLQAPGEDRGALHSNLAAILNRLERAQTQELLDEIGRTRPKDAQSLRRLLFDFVDLARLPKRSLALVVDQVPPDRLVRALGGMGEPFQEAVLAVMSPRARRMVEAELKSMASVSTRECEDARREIAAAVLEMVANGTLELPVSAE